MAYATAPWQQPVDFTTGIAKMLATGWHSDFEIKCGHHTFGTHKVILSAASDFFDRLCDSNFQEGQTSSVNLEDDPALVARLIVFAYTTTYPTASLTSDGLKVDQFAGVDDDSFAEREETDLKWLDRAILHSRMYALADKYGATSLKQHSRQRFFISYAESDEYDSDKFPGDFKLDIDIVESNQSVEGAVDSDSSMSDEEEDIEDWPGTSAWKDSCRVIALVYSTTPVHDRGLRDIVLDSLWAVLDMSHRAMVIDVPGVRKLISDHPQLAYDLAVNPRRGVDTICEHCGREIKANLGFCCAHGKTNSCTDEDCQLLFKRESFCYRCYHLGTIRLRNL